MFRLGRAKCYLLMLMEQAPAVGWVLLVLIAGLTTAGFLISPWVGVAALGLDAFIAVMGLNFVIMAFGFNSITGVNMAMHTLSLRGGKVEVEFEDGKTVEIDTADLRPYKIYPGGVLVPVGGARAGWLWVPPKAFPTDGEFRSFISGLYSEAPGLETA